MGPENWTRVIRLGSSHCYPHNRLTDPLGKFLNSLGLSLLILKIWANSQHACIYHLAFHSKFSISCAGWTTICILFFRPVFLCGKGKCLTPARVVLAHLGLLSACHWLGWPPWLGWFSSSLASLCGLWGWSISAHDVAVWALCVHLGKEWAPGHITGWGWWE